MSEAFVRAPGTRSSSVGTYGSGRTASSGSRLQRYYLAGYIQFIQLLPDAIAMRISNKYLSMIPETDLIQEVVHTMSIQLFKHIIQEEEGRESFVLSEHFIFRQLQGEQETFSLTL